MGDRLGKLVDMGAPDTDVLIVGAGPTGLMLADELALAGVRAVVVDRDLQRSRQTKALNLQPRSAEILDWRGWLDPMLELAFTKLTGGHYAGIPLDYSALDSRFAYQIGIVQADVERTLEAVLAGYGGAPRRGHELVAIEAGISPDDDGVVALLTADGDEYRCAARYLVGADGGRSTVRKLVGVPFPGRDGRYTAVVCDITLARKPAGVAESWAMPEFDPTRTNFVFLLPLRDGLYRFLFGSGRDRHVGRDDEITREEVQRALLGGFGPDIELGELRSGSRFTDATRQVESYRSGRVFLAGDAAHIHSPLGGQGMGLGLQDSFNLGWKLAAAVHGWAPPGLLDSYHGERHPVGAAVLANTRAQGVLTRPDVDVPALRETMTRLLRLPAANRMLAEDISGLSIRYDLGPGAGGRAPDRYLPDGTRLAEHARSGHGLLLDATPDHRFAVLATGWFTRIRYLATDPTDLAASATLIRPDGHIAATTADPEAMADALTAWFGRGTDGVGRSR